MMEKILQAIFLLLLVSFSCSWPLSTNKRWIIDAATGQRVKLSCINWAAHMEAMLPEGLNKRPIKEIMDTLVDMRFNCVRLTWATFMFTRADYGQAKVEQTLDSLGLKDAKDGIAKNNFFFLNLTHVQAFEVVIDALGTQGIMVFLDNHISKPGWCCSASDGNGFFGDENFNPDEWLQGLSFLAKFVITKEQVVGIGLRNELRGSRQNKDDWYKYMSEGVGAVHDGNPHVLVLVSGLNYDLDLSFLKEKPLALGLERKIVYEIHWYSFSQDQGNWKNQPLNTICSRTIQTFIDNSAFLTYGDNPVPLFLGEFGFDQGGGNLADEFYMTCLMAYVAERNLDWALWALQGRYYLGDGQAGLEEAYGALDAEWQRPRNPNFIQRLRFIQTLNEDPNSKEPKSYSIFHPLSGTIVTAYGNNNRWLYDGDGSPIKLLHTSLCLNVVGDGLSTTLSIDCSSEQSKWMTVSPTKMHLSAKDQHGQLLCLQRAPNSTIFTTKCICIEDDSQCMENPQIQWFKFALTNVK